MKVLTNNQYYSDIADTIRQMKGVATTYKPREMASALRDMYSTEVEGTPPLTFPSNGNNLLNYRIDGANGGVGDLVTDTSDENYGKYKIPVIINGKNLFDGNLIQGYYSDSNMDDLVATTSNYRTLKIYLPSGTYTFSSSVNIRIIRFVTSTVYQQNPNGNNFVKSYTFQINDNGYISLSFRNESNTAWDNSVDLQIEEGLTSTSFETYYEPTTTNIYLDEPIEVNESKELSDTNVNIPTINGTNILSIDTTIQPSNVYVQAPKTNNYNL